MSVARDRVVEVLISPAVLERYTQQDWELLLRQGRHANLVAHLERIIWEQGFADRVPEPAAAHFLSAGRLAERHSVAVRWEARCISAALADLGTPHVFLKGAAYVMAGLPAARGRLFSDVDIMVPRAQLALAEEKLVIGGWFATHHSDYDQRYYRQWMHELPPLRHITRQSVLDLHHTILPPTAGVKLDAARLFEASVSLNDSSNARTLAPADMVLHSAAHLFFEGEFANGLRDLVDLDALLRHFGDARGFWDTLAARATELDLERPLFYALRYAVGILGTPVPASLVEKVDPFGPDLLRRQLMDILFTRALRPHHASCDDALSGIARWLLYVRSHALRMPLHLLVPHLMRKALRRGDRR